MTQYFYTSALFHMLEVGKAPFQIWHIEAWHLACGAPHRFGNLTAGEIYTATPPLLPNSEVLHHRVGWAFPLPPALVGWGWAMPSPLPSTPCSSEVALGHTFCSCWLAQALRTDQAPLIQLAGQKRLSTTVLTPSTSAAGGLT